MAKKAVPAFDLGQIHKHCVWKRINSSCLDHEKIQQGGVGQEPKIFVQNPIADLMRQTVNLRPWSEA